MQLCGSIRYLRQSMWMHCDALYSPWLSFWNPISWYISIPWAAALASTKGLGKEAVWKRRNNSHFPSSPPTVWDEAHIWAQWKLPLAQNYRMNEEAKLIAYIVYQKAELYDLSYLASQRLASAPPCYSSSLLNPLSSSPLSNTRLINIQPLPNWQWFRISSAIPWPSEWDSTEVHTSKLLNTGFIELLILAG